MKILWVVNLILPKVAPLIGIEKVPFGGWVANMIEQLNSNTDFEIGVAMRGPVNKLLLKNIEGITYYILPQNSYDAFDINEDDCKYVLDHFKPNLLHVEGSESAQALKFLETWNGKNVVSMQGILNGYEQYELGGIKFSDCLYDWQSLIMFLSKKLNTSFVFSKRKRIESKTILKAKNILGRTHWDRAHAYVLNKSAPYFSCNRILRSGFYKAKRDPEKIEPFKIFIGNSAQPRKGAHVVLKAIKLLEHEYPEVKLVIAGTPPRATKFFDLKYLVGYRFFLKRLISKYSLSDKVKFLGVLDEYEMISELVTSHVFVMASIIENSPNTLGEAMILGVPSISSYMGGVSDMATDGQEVLFYRDNDPVLLAFRLKQLFDDTALATKISKNAIVKAMKSHNPEVNYKMLVKAYNEILNKVD